MQKQPLLGYIDSYGLTTISGWAAYPSGDEVELTTTVNGQIVGKTSPSVSRADLEERFSGRPVGFEMDLGRLLNPGDIVAVRDAYGSHLQRSPSIVPPTLGTKEEKALALITRAMKILEIGPGYAPIAPRSAGWNSRSLDHATQAELRKKYSGQQTVDRIEPVDYVWQGGPIETAIPLEEHGTFDAIIASHVLEHIPDPLMFFISAAKLLRPGGVLSVVLPDKRRCFDFFRPISNTAAYLAAHLEKRSRHSVTTIFESSSYVSERHAIAWDAHVLQEFNFFQSIETVYKQMQTAFAADASQPYQDFHATTYTPSSFALIILELRALQLMPFRIMHSYPTAGCEFWVSLVKDDIAPIDDAELNLQRLNLMKATVRELAEQAHLLQGG